MTWHFLTTKLTISFLLMGTITKPHNEIHLAASLPEKS